MIDLNDFCRKSWEVAKKRQENGAKLNTDTMAMLKHCASEVVEATEVYGMLEETIGTINEEAFASELADVIACILIICANEPTIDIENALQKCFEKNLARAEGRGDKK